MLKRVVSEAPVRRLCTAASNALREKASAAFEKLMFADWVDTDDKLENLASEADDIVAAYRPVYASNPNDATTKAMERLHLAKEAARITEAYSDHVQYLIRHHEGMLGLMGDETSIEEGQEKEAISVIKEYVEIVNKIKDREVQGKLETELGRKMILLRQALSIANFSKEVTPVAGYRLVTRLKK